MKSTSEESGKRQGGCLKSDSRKSPIRLDALAFERIGPFLASASVSWPQSGIECRASKREMRGKHGLPEMFGRVFWAIKVAEC